MALSANNDQVTDSVRHMALLALMTVIRRLFYMILVISLKKVMHCIEIKILTDVVWKMDAQPMGLISFLWTLLFTSPTTCSLLR